MLNTVYQLGIDGLYADIGFLPTSLWQDERHLRAVSGRYDGLWLDAHTLSPPQKALSDVRIRCLLVRLPGLRIREKYDRAYSRESIRWYWRRRYADVCLSLLSLQRV